MEDVSHESETEMKKHLLSLVEERLRTNRQDTNPWLDEIWQEGAVTNPASSCKRNQSLLECSLRDLTHFKIDSKVENVMNVAVLFSDTFRNYRRAICPRNSDHACIHDNFDGEDYFNNHILNARSEF